jgi:2-oxoglutarate ferredoxin oxidoreductase subunit alpha
MTSNGTSADVPARPFTAGDFARVRRAIGKSVLFVQGDIAVGYGALLAGCRFFAGYPITPATETAEVLAQLMPKIGGAYVQMEDEIASIGAVVGASWAGAKAMTATSGPGFSLMQENIGYAAMTEAPCVIVDVQRSGPSTGQPTEGAQGDIMQAKWGSHGDYEIIALSPSTVQECLDFTIKAFNLAEEYRVPVIVLTDGIVGHMREKIILPEYDQLNLVWRKEPSIPKGSFQPYVDDGSKIPEMGIFGQGFRTYITGLTHKESGYPSTDSQSDHHRLVKRLCDKIRDTHPQSVAVEVPRQGGGGRRTKRVGVVSYGITSRPVRHAVLELRGRKLSVEHLRIITNWPFPEHHVAELTDRVEAVFVPELNMGQVYHLVREAAGRDCRVIPLWKTGGEMHTPQEIIDSVLAEIG